MTTPAAMQCNEALMLTHPSGISARFQTTFQFDLPGGVAARGI